MPDFDAFNAARKELRAEGPSFDLAGKTWKCIPGSEIDGGSMMSALVANEEYGFTHALLRMSLGEKQYAQLLGTCRDKGVIVDTLLEVAFWLFEQYTARPTAPSSSTADGQRSDGDGSKKQSRRKDSAAA